MKRLFAQDFGRHKLMIGMVHTRALPDTPVVVGTGVSADNIQELSRVADAFIIGTSLKRDGKTLNPVDPQRARRFMQAASPLAA